MTILLIIKTEWINFNTIQIKNVNFYPANQFLLLFKQTFFKSFHSHRYIFKENFKNPFVSCPRFYLELGYMNEKGINKCSLVHINTYSKTISRIININRENWPRRKQCCYSFICAPKEKFLLLPKEEKVRYFKNK